MISVRNHLPQLSGNKWLLYLCISLVTGACSPKVRPVAPPVKTETEKPVKPPPPPKPEKPKPQKPSTISLLLPFGLDHLNPGASYTDVSLKQATLSLDYYQGFKLALDSLTGLGYSYKLRVFDTRGTVAQARRLARNPQIKASELIIGPIFPDDLKAFITSSPGEHAPVLSPLSPAPPATYNNPHLITVIPPLEYHARAAAQYINARIKPQKIFILKSGYSDENEYIAPFKRTTDSLSKGRVQVIQLIVIHGQLAPLLPQLSTDRPNIFVIPSTNQAFLMVTLRTLDSLLKTYPIIVFGHPDWNKFNFLHTDILQRLRTHITSTDQVDYKDPATVEFLRYYRNTYHVEPGEYAIKGFDEGLYFGKILGDEHGEIKGLDEHDFTGLHNVFHFIKKPGQGWINIHVNILAYQYYELKRVE